MSVVGWRMLATGAAAPMRFAAARALATAATGVPAAVSPNSHRTENQKRVQIRLEAFEVDMLDEFVRFTQDTAWNLHLIPGGRVALPTHIRRWTVNRSPHIDKKSREQFEMRTHKRLVQVHNVPPIVLDFYVKYLAHHLPAGLGMKVRKFDYQRVPTRTAELLARARASN